MKKIWILSLFCFMLLMKIFLSNVYAATLYDDFSGSSVDTTKWSTATGETGSSVTESNGYLVINAMGFLNTVSQFNPTNGKITIASSVKLNNSNASFQIITRSDKTYNSSTDNYIHNGILISIGTGNTGIAKMVNAVQTTLTNVNSTVSSGSFHDVTVTDDGTNRECSKNCVMKFN
ncbi:MAG: hypothetical protein HQK88_16465 [Nitrospirae bacterium]|nr:hypothetical protein [Nitrospirota bacterium]